MLYYCHRTGSDTKYSCYIYGRTTEYVDNIRFLYRTFPLILTITITITFCVVGFVFKNFFLPIRLFLTIALPMTLIFGFCVLIYNKGAFDDMHIAALKKTKGLNWMIPLMSLTLLLGLALDYDIFLYARIDEYMKYGVNLRNAIVRGVFKTGNIITSAGIIMAFAFFGLLFSKVAAINQMGFILVVGVLVDTFIIRTSLVPAILSVTTNVVWYPPWKQPYLNCTAPIRSWWNGWEEEQEAGEPYAHLAPQV